MRRGRSISVNKASESHFNPHKQVQAVCIKSAGCWCDTATVETHLPAGEEIVSNCSWLAPVDSWLGVTASLACWLYRAVFNGRKHPDWWITLLLLKTVYLPPACSEEWSSAGAVLNNVHSSWLKNTNMPPCSPKWLFYDTENIHIIFNDNVFECLSPIFFLSFYYNIAAWHL